MNKEIISMFALGFTIGLSYEIHNKTKILLIVAEDIDAQLEKNSAVTDAFAASLDKHIKEQSFVNRQLLFSLDSLNKSLIMLTDKHRSTDSPFKSNE